MNTTLCVLNLTDSTNKLTPELDVTTAISIDSPEAIPSDPSVILYVVGHGRNNRLVGKNGAILEEEDVAKAILSQRRNQQTLIVWDVCFAESLLQIPNVTWPDEFVHIFSCRSFERTWHGGRQPNGVATTLFSIELKKAVTALRVASSNFDWNDLERTLQSQFQSESGSEKWFMQMPSIQPEKPRPSPGDFDLGTLIGQRQEGAATVTSDDTPSPSPAQNAKPDATTEPTHHGKELRGIKQAPATATPEGRFGRMFPDLEPRGNETPTPTQLGLPNGPMDGGSTPQPSETLFALMTYFGQFVDHDISFDPTSSLEQQQDPEAILNFRTPVLELDHLYGSGPGATPFFYDQENANKLLLGRASNGDQFVDVPRSHQGTAIIADPRNDDNLIVSQLHVAFIKFHNAIVDHLGDFPDDGDKSPFEKAQRLVRWHYQWLVLHEFLPAIVGQATVDDVMQNGRKLYQPKAAFIPVEFSVAAYRFGHSMVRPRYVINDHFRAVLFSTAPKDATFAVPNARMDLRGGPIRFEDRINWKNFVNTGFPESTGDGTTRFSNKIDTQLSAPLLNLPSSVVPANTPPERRSLAVRNLMRGLALKLPSGQAVANRVASLVAGTKQLTDTELWDNPKTQEFKNCSAPLWYYFLREAELLGKGEKLGPVGGRIVAEVLIGLLDLDPSSFRKLNPAWTPTAKGRPSTQFGFREFFEFAGVDIQ